MSRQRNCRETDGKTEGASNAYREFAQKEELGTSAHSGSLQAFYIQPTVMWVLTRNGKFMVKVTKVPGIRQCRVSNEGSRTRERLSSTLVRNYGRWEDAGLSGRGWKFRAATATREKLGTQRVRRFPAHSPRVKSDEDENVEKRTEDEIEDRHKKDRPVQQVNLQHILLWHKEN
jgi:hypothetical protein